MKAKHLLLSLLLGLGLAVGLLLALGGRSAPAGATSQHGPMLSEVKEPVRQPQRAAMAGSVITVCLGGGCDYSSVQDAVDGAVGGDIIKVAQGAYTGVQQRAGITQVVYISKSLTIQGGYTTTNWTTPYPLTQPTTLDAQGQGRVLVVTGAVAPILEGLRITGGDATGLGGGLGIASSGANGAGGGAFVVTATVTFSNCTIFDNLASGSMVGYGGGLYLYFSPATLTNNAIYSNTAGSGGQGYGGGAYLEESDAALTGNAIYSNTASSVDTGGGGGVQLEFCDAELTGNVIRDNIASASAWGFGGGLNLGDGGTELRDNVVRDNVASTSSKGKGGGIQAHGAPLLVNTVLVGNSSGTTADSCGAGISVEFASVRMLHTTLHDNTGSDGSGICVEGSVALTNTILTSQTVGITVTAGSTATLNGVLWHANSSGNAGGAGLINLSNEYTHTPAFAGDGYHLTSGSYAIDRGVSSGVTDDIDGEARDTPDLGADEWVSAPAELEVCPSGCTYSTIQAAVDAANPGDTVKVALGNYDDVYQRAGITQVVYISKTITIRGGYLEPGFAEPPDPDTNLTTLEAGGQGRVIYITGGINPTIEGLRITGGDATGLGGGPFGMDSGGGVYVVTATATISNNHVFSNTSGSVGNGGGLYLHQSDGVVANNGIYSNTCGSCGGGLFVHESSATVSGNAIYANQSDCDGGGVCTEEGSATFRGNTIYSNTAGDYGGGVFAYHAVDTLVNNAVFDNSAGKAGSGLHVDTSSFYLVHTTVARNTGGDGSGVHVTDDGGPSHSFVVLTNTILVSQTTGITVGLNNTGILKGVLWFINGANTGGAGFINATDEYTGSPAFAGDGYHLTSGSYAIDRGVSTGVTDDIDGETRNAPDLGADEWVSAPAELEVCPSGCTYSTIQAAVDAANPGDIVKVAADVYDDVHQRVGITQVVYISKTVTIRGGYLAPGFAEPPDPDTNVTILDAGGRGRVVYITGGINPTLEGLHLTGGDATGLGGGPWSYDGAGGGVYVFTATATISGCEVYGNLASSVSWNAGGGIYLWHSPSRLINNEIYNNTASEGSHAFVAGEGGGVAMAGSDATLTGNVIRDNVASDGDEGIGGGLYIEGCDPVLRDNVVRGNAASDITYGQGGGIYVGPFSSPVMTNTVLYGNFGGTTADSWGAGLAVEMASVRLVHPTIHYNSGGVGNGVYAMSGSTVAMTNAIVADQATVGITVETGCAVTIDGVLWYDNGANVGGGGSISVTNELTGAPAFAADGYHLQSGSKAIDAGVQAGVAWDIDGQPRYVPDLGADEWSGEITVDSDTGGAIIFVNGQGLTTTIEVAPGAVTETVTLQFTPIPSSTLPPLPGSLKHSSIAFELDAFCYRSYSIYLPLLLRSYSGSSSRAASGIGAAHSTRRCEASSLSSSSGPTPCSPQFQIPVTITIYYSDADIAGLDESSLRLYYWTGAYWEDAAATCSPASTYFTDTVANVLQVPICHLSEFGLMGD